MASPHSKIIGAAFDGTNVGVDYPSYLAQHDIVYKAPPRLGEQGMPFGDGDTGAMVWCPPGEMRLQINKSDLWWENPRAQSERSDDWRLLSAGGLSIRTDPSPLRAPQRFEQRLNLYHALVTLEADAPEGACQAGLWASSAGNVLCVQYQDQILRARSRVVELTTWRSARLFTGENAIGLVETLSDRRFALVCRLVGQAAQPAWIDAQTVRFDLSSARSAGFTLFIVVAVTHLDGDPVHVAHARLEQAVRRGAETLLREHKTHWHAFWQKSFLSLSSPDGAADYLENLWHFNLYQLASCSRGLYAPKPDGGLWLTNRDERADGGGYRHWSAQMLYWPVFAANHPELATPYFETYSQMLPVVERETQRRFQMRGARFPDIASRFGEEIAGPSSPRAPLSLSNGLECAMLFWWGWQFTRDRRFLREQVYPLLRACVTFYQEYAQRGSDGEVVLSLRSVYGNDLGMRNATNDLAALRFGLRALIEASIELNVDQEERADWADLLHHLPDYPTLPGKNIWAECMGVGRLDARLPELAPVFPSGEVGLNSPDYARAVRTFFGHGRAHNLYGWSLDALVAARLGLRNHIAALLRQHVEEFQIYPQGFYHNTAKCDADRTDRNPYLEPLGVLATTLNEMCVQGHDGLIRLFPALPRSWEATFQLQAAGGFGVLAQITDGTVVWAAIQSREGGLCHVANPWADTARVQDGRVRVLESAEPVLELDTEPGHLYVIDRAERPLRRMPRFRLSGKRNAAPKRLGSRQIGLP